MTIHLNENPSEADINAVRHRLQEHNSPHWEVDDRHKFVLTTSIDNRMIGGIVFTLFGQWLEIDFFWVDPEQRNRGIGKSILHEAEDFARSKGCKTSSLNTFNFQAKPFYEKNGYAVVYTQENYPVRNSRYFMEKAL